MVTGAILGGLGVAIGAFGAHALKPVLLANDRVETFELAVRYQFYHALALLLIGLAFEKFQSGRLAWSALLTTMGVLVFSGSLFILSLTGVTKWGAVTPFGGVLLIAGWIFFVLALLQKKK